MLDKELLKSDYNNDLVLYLLIEDEKYLTNAITKQFPKQNREYWCRKFEEPETRIQLKRDLMSGKFKITPPRVCEIPKKDSDEMREVMVVDDVYRIFLTAVNDIWFDYCSKLIHHSCVSYQAGKSSQSSVVKAADFEKNVKRNDCGKKYDMKKFFDSCRIEWIEWVKDRIDNVMGKSCVTDCVSDFYHNDLLIDKDGQLKSIFKSIKQGTATSAFLADAILYEVDKKMSELKGVFYMRYSDDIIILGEHWEEADKLLKELLNKMSLSVNPKKEEILYKDRFFKFLGFSILGGNIRTISKGRLDDYIKEIRKLTHYGVPFQKAVRDVMWYLYGDQDGFSWFSAIAEAISCPEDLDELTKWTLDRLRMTLTNKRYIRNPGYEPFKLTKKGPRKSCITYTLESGGPGSPNAAMNMEKIPEIVGFLPLNKALELWHMGRETFYSELAIRNKIIQQTNYKEYICQLSNFSAPKSKKGKTSKSASNKSRSK